MTPQSKRLESTRQRCKVCGNADKLNFNVPDDLWARIVPAEFEQRVVCLACFDDFAREQGVAYSEALTALYFAGDRAVFEFRVVTAVDSKDFHKGETP